MKLRILISLVVLILAVAGLYVVSPPIGRLYQDQNSYSLVWKDEWLGFTLNQEVVLETDYWNEDNVDLSPGFSPLFQDVKLDPGESFFAKRGARCVRIRIDRILNPILFTVFEGGSSRSFESIDGSLKFEGFDIGVSASKAGAGELFVFASGVSDGEIIWFSFPSQPEVDAVTVTCDEAKFVRYPWETAKKWVKLQKGG